MRKEELLALAKQYYIFDAGLSLPNLIRKIQIAEGHDDCFAMDKTGCDETACMWRKVCLTESSEGLQTDSSGSAASATDLIRKTT